MNNLPVDTTITKDSVKKVGLLSRLFTKIDDDKLDLYQSQLAAILSYADNLSKIDTSQYSVHGAINSIAVSDLRDDQPDPDTETYQRVRQNIMRNFPARQGDFLELPVRIIEDN